MTSFSFYTDIIPLDSASHRQLRQKPVSDFSFAQKTQSVAIGAGEFFDVAVEFPIVFVRAAHGLVPVALLGARPDENLFVGKNGEWECTYRPLFIQRYPFVTLNAEDQRISVGFDQASSLIQDSEGERLLTDAGEPSEHFKTLIKFLDRSHGEFLRGETLAKTLDEKKLLQPMSAQMSVDGGAQVELSGFEVVDVAKLDAMSIGEQGLLAKTGELAMIHAHLVSMRNFRKLLGKLEILTKST